MSMLPDASLTMSKHNPQPILADSSAATKTSAIDSPLATKDFAGETSGELAGEFSAFAQKMSGHKLPRQLQTLFASYYDQVRNNLTGHISENSIRPIGRDDVASISELEDHTASGQRLMDQAVAIKLNGGLGTSMGMTYAKSLIPVRNNKTFLDLLVQQAVAMTPEGAQNLPLVLMNSFSTEYETIQALRDMQELPAMPLNFTQHKFPKISQETLQPVEFAADPTREWNPPGHGDIFAALVLSGVLDTLLKQGRRYAFISNSDNLGATVDPRLLGYVADNNLPFLMEVAPRTVNDRKGGHLAKLPDGGLILRELAQCPEEDLHHFQDIERYGLFNTNNIWVDLKALSDHVRRHGLLRLPMILNPKTVNPRDKSSEKVFQVESAMGAAISCFPGAQAVVTSRSRFIPVKKCNDLLAVMSDCFEEQGSLIRPATTCKQTPSIQLDGEYYTAFDSMLARFPHGAPSLKDCTSLTISGDVSFGRNVVITGDVTITNTTGEQVVISDRSKLEGDITF